MDASCVTLILPSTFRVLEVYVSGWRGGDASGCMILFLCYLPQFYPHPPCALVQHIQKLFKGKAIYNTEWDLFMDKVNNKTQPQTTQRAYYLVQV